MANVKDLLRTIWDNKDIRNKLILVLLVVVFLIILIYNMVGKDYYDERMLMCPDTRKAFRATVKNNDISEQICPHCNRPVGFAFKCSDCDYEFCYKPKKPSGSLTTEQRRQYYRVQKRCPNCKSLSTYQMSAEEVEESKKRREKEELKTREAK